MGDRIHSREAAIELIAALFPADSPYPHTAYTGQHLLDQARRDASRWQDEPDDVLIRYAELCIDEYKRQIDNLERARCG